MFCTIANCLSISNASFVFVTDGLWSHEKPKVLKLGILPVKAMLAVEEHLWASSGGQVFIISTLTHSIEVRNLALILLPYLHYKGSKS